MKLPEFWKTGAAVLVLAGLGSYIWFVERKHEPKAEGEREKVTVLAVDKAKAKEISLATAAGETIRLVKEGAGWKVTAPFTAPADTSAVESLLTSLEKLEADEVVVEQAASLAEYGLDKPEPHDHRGRRGRPRARSPSSSGPSRRTARASTPGRGRRRRSTSCPSGSRAASTRSPSTCATGTSSTSSATTSGPWRSRGRRGATPSRGRTPASGRSRSPSPRAPAAGRWTVFWARSRTCAWSRWRWTARPTRSPSASTRPRGRSPSC